MVRGELLRCIAGGYGLLLQLSSLEILCFAKRTYLLNDHTVGWQFQALRISKLRIGPSNTLIAFINLSRSARRVHSIGQVLLLREQGAG
jgi:hypothetical protein